MSSACAQLGILAVGLIASRHNAARVSMTPFSSAEIYAESTCYDCRAYAPQTRVSACGSGPGWLGSNDLRSGQPRISDAVWFQTQDVHVDPQGSQAYFEDDRYLPAMCLTPASRRLVSVPEQTQYFQMFARFGRGNERHCRPLAQGDCHQQQ